MRERRGRQIVVGQRREYLIDQLGPPCEAGPDHVDRTFRPDEVGRPPQVEPPLQIGAASGPQAKVSVLADDLHCHILFGDVGNGGQSLPAAPAGRLRGFPTGDMSNLRVQTIRTDQQIPVRAAAVFELDPHPVLRIERRGHTGVALDAIGRESPPADGRAGRGEGPSGRARPTCPTIVFTAMLTSGRPVDVAIRTVDSN